MKPAGFEVPVMVPRLGVRMTFFIMGAVTLRRQARCRSTWEQRRQLDEVGRSASFLDEAPTASGAR